MKRSEKLDVLQKTQEALGLEDEKLNYLPDIAERLAAHIRIPPIAITVVLDPVSMQVRQVTNSDISRDAETLAKVSRAMTYVAEQYSNLALEVAQNATNGSETTGLETAD